MLRLLVVTGTSLCPDLQDGDFVVMTKIPIFFRQLKPGDHVVFDRPEYGTMVKQVLRYDRQNDEVFVVGTHPFSIDSRQFGPVKRVDLRGKILFHIPKTRKNVA